MGKAAEKTTLNIAEYCLLSGIWLTTARLRHGVCCNFASRGFYSILTTLALILFEYVFNIDQEVKLFWGRKLTGAVVLFLVNRYTTLIYTVYYVLISLIPSALKTAQASRLHHRYC